MQNGDLYGNSGADPAAAFRDGRRVAFDYGKDEGARGIMLNMLAKQRPEYIEAADTIAASDAVTTLLRCPGIKDGNNTTYFLTKEGEQPTHKNIDRAGSAQCMYDLIQDESLGVNESLGITN